jgi:8-hydroxy-5-deazaflavin:NADPH oxidoreductase
MGEISGYYEPGDIIMSDLLQPVKETIGILGGTGKEGKGLAYRWAKAGHKVIIGSRSNEKAINAANELLELLKTADISGSDNLHTAMEADLLVLTVPFAVHQETLLYLKDALKGKILIDVTVPLVPPRVTRVQMPPAGSAAQEAQEILGPDVQVISAFQNISYEHLLHDEPVDCDVLVCGGNKTARASVLRLVKEAGLIGWDAGPIENSVIAEGLTSILIGLNKQFGVASSGIRITGIERPE